MRSVIDGVDTETSNVIALPIRVGRDEATSILRFLHLELIQKSTDADTSRMGSSPFDTANRLLQLYRKRNALLGDALFGDPSWAILLDLYVARCLKRNISVTSACVGSMAPASTALRHLEALIAQGMLERSRPSHDARLIYVGLSKNGFESMTNLLSAMI